MLYFKNTFVLSLLMLGAVSAQLLREEAHPAPEPYSFAFESPNEDGSSSARQETGDANGRIQGFYIIKGADGQDRRVDYVADENGFRAEVSTNEIGTVTHEAAAALYKSSAPSVEQLIAQWESSGAGAAAASRRQRIIETGASRVATRIINTGAALNLGGARLSTIQSGGFTGGASTFITRPAIAQGALATRTVAVSGVQNITPEGYVIVPASAARGAGLQTYGPEFSTLQAAQNTYSSGYSKPLLQKRA